MNIGTLSMNTITKELCKKVKFYREKMGLTQEELSEKLSINFRSLSLIERGVNFVSAKTLENLCKIFEVKPSSLFNFNCYEENPKNVKTAINNIIENNQDKLDLIYKLLKAMSE